MPNFINRRKKKVKVPEQIVNCDCDSDSSSYGFSSKLNSSFSQQSAPPVSTEKRKTTSRKNIAGSSDNISLKYELKISKIES